MLIGTVIRIGDMTVADEKLHGISIECDKELLKNYKTNLLYRDVVILERLNGEIDITELDKLISFRF